MTLLPHLLAFIMLAVLPASAVLAYVDDGPELRTSFAAALLLGATLAPVAAWTLRRHIVREPVRRLINIADAVRDGLCPSCVSLGEGTFEFAPLEHALSGMVEALDAREAGYRAIFEMSGRGKMQIDPKTGRFLRVNRAFCEMTGYSEEALRHRTLVDIIHPEDRPAAVEAYERLIRGEIPVFDQERRYVRQDGAVIWVRANVVLLRDRDGRPARTVGVVEDITDRKQSEDLIRETMERYRLAARATNDAVWDWNMTSDHVLWNEAVTKLFGYSPENIGASILWWENNIHPGDSARVLSGILAAIDGPGETWSGEYRFRTADGSWADVLDRVYVVRDPRGEAIRVIGAMLDISGRKRFEERLRMLAAEVDHRAKNVLAVVQVMLRQTRADTIQEYAAAAQGRVAALARAHTLLSKNGWRSVDLRNLAENEFAPLRPSVLERIHMNGPAVAVSPQAVQSFALVLHELASNTVTHGSLSVPQGQVEMNWSVRPDGKHVVRWMESGGPLISPPARRGLGTNVIEQSIDHHLEGRVRFDWRPEGLACELVVPATRLTAADVRAHAAS